MILKVGERILKILNGGEKKFSKYSNFVSGYSYILNSTERVGSVHKVLRIFKVLTEKILRNNLKF